MTANEKTVLREYQVRKTRKQKNSFYEYVRPFAENLGYTVKKEKGSFGAQNIVIGDIDTAKVVFAAHYDTCAVMPVPNFITPKNIFIYLLYQFGMTAGIFSLSIITTIICGFILPEIAPIAGLVCLYALLILLVFGPANKHTANDNTSGVLTVLEAMAEMPEDIKHKAAFVLFDFEEVGLLGSSGFFSRHKKVMSNKLLINFDCVSDGDHILFLPKKKAKSYEPLLESALERDENFTVEIAHGFTFYPSDQANFPLGIGVAALNKSAGGTLYMDKIHTRKDTVYEEENIKFLKRFCVNLTRKIQ